MTEQVGVLRELDGRAEKDDVKQRQQSASMRGSDTASQPAGIRDAFRVGLTAGLQWPIAAKGGRFCGRCLLLALNYWMKLGRRTRLLAAPPSNTSM